MLRRERRQELAHGAIPDHGNGPHVNRGRGRGERHEGRERLLRRGRKGVLWIEVNRHYGIWGD